MACWQWGTLDFSLWFSPLPACAIVQFPQHSRVALTDCLAASCFTASFHVVPFVVFSAHCLANGFITFWDTLRGEASVNTKPLEDFDILVCPFIPFGTCSWCSQLHTAIVAVGHFILTDGQCIIISGSDECLPEFHFKGTSHAFGCYLSVLQPKIYIK